MSTDHDLKRRLKSLTSLDRQCLGLLGTGLGNAGIARIMKVQPQTVANRLSMIYKKLDVSSRAEAVRIASRLD